jgi:hypothetical protein
VKPDVENIRGLNLAVVRLATVQVTKLPLKHGISKIGIVYTGRGLLYSAKGRIFNNMLFVRYVHLTKGQAYS